MMFLFLMLIMFTGVISAGLRFAWGTAKFVFGLGLFFICPILFVLAVFLGMVSHLWLPILLIGLLLGRRFKMC